jgi:hypothetical protein
MVVKSTALTIALGLMAALGLLAFGFAGTASAQTAGAGPGIGRTDPSAHAQAQPKRARTRVRVTPRCLYRTQTVDYPVPYECEYPGPGYVRQCVAQLVQERRPSGTVIVPTTRCWWEPG